RGRLHSQSADDGQTRCLLSHRQTNSDLVMIPSSFVSKIRLTSKSLKNLQRTMSSVAETFLAVKRKEREEEDGQLAANDSVQQSFHEGQPPRKKPPVINNKRKNLSKD